MNFSKEASRLTEQIFNVQGSNRANEVEKILKAKLIETWDEAVVDTICNVDRIKEMGVGKHAKC